MLDAARRVLASVAAHGRGRRIARAGIASQRSTIILWERETGRPLGPAISWMDRRAAGLVAKISSSSGSLAATIARRTGLRLTPHYGASHLARLLAQSPKLAREARGGAIVAGPVASYVLTHLGRGGPAACDPTLAQRTLLYAVGRGGWDRSLCSLFRIPSNVLPMVRPSASFHGSIVVGGRDVPVVALAGDQQAAAAAFDLDRPRSALVHYGTGAFVLWPAPSPIAPSRRGGLLLSARADVPGRFYLEGTVNAAGAAIDALGRWIGRREVDRALRRMTESAPRREEAVLVPAFAGLGAPHWDASARVVLLARAESIRAPQDLARAVLLGIAHSVADILGAGAGSLPSSAPLILSGPLAEMPILARLQCETARRPVRIAREKEATLRGIARIASRAGEREIPAAPAGAARQPLLPPASRLELREEWRRAVGASCGRPMRL